MVRILLTILLAGVAMDEELRTVSLTLAPGEGNPRNSEGAFLHLKDGSILFVYTHFTGGAADEAAAHLAARVSKDGGKTWSPTDEKIPTPKGGQNVMSVSLLRLDPETVALIYLVKNSWSDCRPYMQVSKDEGKTWGEAVALITEPDYYVINNDRVVKLSSGRIILPLALHTRPDARRFVPRAQAVCLISDDGGTSWRKSKTVLEAPAASRSGLQEPLVVELKDKRLMMLARTDQGCQMRSHSTDNGETWSEMEKTDITSPLAPASVKRIPGSGHLLMLWNNTKGPKRTPLTVAVSKDEGKTWVGVQDIETDPDGWYCYTAIEFVKEQALLAYCAGNPKNRLGTTRIVLLDLSKTDR